MYIVDTHSHMYDETFLQDWLEVEKKNDEANVQKVLLPNVDSTTIDIMHQTVDKNPSRYIPMMGLHPTSVKENFEDELAIIKNHLFINSEKYIAVGEIGMDLFWDVNFEAQQRQAFITQVGWANELQLPISIHARKTTHLLIEILKKQIDCKAKGIFHCFSGSKEEAIQITQLGYKLGMGGVITFKNSKMADVITSVGIEHLVLETDAPYLSPEPYRGKRNESSYTRLVAYKLADILGISIHEVIEKTTNNAIQIFKKLA